MKFGDMILASLALAFFHRSVVASRLSTVGSSDNLKKIVTLLTDLQAKIEADGAAEQKSYDKFACWCEETLSEKAEAISTAKEDIDKLQTEIISLKGALAAHAVDIKQLEKDIAANVESQREATEVREKESEAYLEDKNENEQCIGALEAAITVLTGAGTGAKKGFLETLQEAQLLSVVAGVRGLLKRPTVQHSVDEQDLQVVRHFVDRPEDFVGSRTGVISAAQIANNPFGDYAPQSTQIQGILKGMYDAFTADLEKSNTEEAEKQKGFEDLMKTKKTELATLQDTLDKNNMDEAEKTKKLADSKTALDDTKAQLEADEAFFAATKTSCQEKATQWAQRTRLRTEELQGVAKAIEILSSPEAEETFKKAETTFLQISAANSQSGTSVYDRLKALATKYSSLSLARIAATAQSGGHFDRVLVAIDKMIAMLREEAQLDVKDRDFCERKQGKNKNDMEDLNYDIEKAKQTIDRLENEAKELEAKVEAQEKEIKTTKKNIKELTEMREKEEKEFLQAVKDDTDAIALLDEAIVAMTKFYRKNKMPELLQSGSVQAADPQPELAFKDGKYGGRSGESKGVVAILSMLKEDFEKEIKTGREEDAVAQANFEKDRQSLFDTLEAQKELLMNTKKELSEMKLQIADVTEHKEQKGKDLEEEEKMKESLTKNCAWVKSHFKSRRDKRQAEIDGLIEAKNFLAGME
mmetsp:Transcript_60879/g.117327  ORF Transcript_60879/g.117327 Transcript_60879/m.117327 type:complete len:698 (+) Transcript_60879:89-2182(+)